MLRYDFCISQNEVNRTAYIFICSISQIFSKPLPRAYRSLSEFRFRSPFMVVTMTGMILLHRQKKYKSNLQKIIKNSRNFCVIL